MPNVNVGSIIDIEYSYSGMPTEFYFQADIPVKYAELNLEKSQYISFKKRSIGYEHIELLSDGRFAASNMKAFKHEPFMDSDENYINKMEIDIMSINHPSLYSVCK